MLHVHGQTGKWIIIPPQSQLGKYINISAQGRTGIYCTDTRTDRKGQTEKYVTIPAQGWADMKAQPYQHNDGY